VADKYRHVDSDNPEESVKNPTHQNTSVPFFDEKKRRARGIVKNRRIVERAFTTGEIPKRIDEIRYNDKVSTDVPAQK
jgi:hypothetical protein